EDDPKDKTASGIEKITAGDVQQGYEILTESYFLIINMLKESSGNSEYLFFNDQVSEHFDDEQRAILVETLEHLINAAFTLDRKSVSCRYLEKYLELNSSSGSDWKRLGDTYLEIYEPKKALNAFRRGVANDPANEDMWNSLRELYKSKNQNQEAELCEKSLSGNSIDMRREIALELLLLGRDQFAQRYAVTPFLDENPENPTALKMEAKCWLIHHGFPMAKSSLEKAMTIDSDDHDIQWTYIRALCKANELENAREQLIDYMKMVPNTTNSKNLISEIDKRIKLEEKYGREKVSFVFLISVGGERDMSRRTMPLGTTVLEAAYNHLWSPLVTMSQSGFRLAKGFKTQELEISNLYFRFSDPRGGPQQIERSQPAGLNDIVIQDDIIWVSER
ncbi:MAG: tetratricopeptide repeat protein, partial [Candidatus Thorarchaeota archaeon]